MILRPIGNEENQVTLCEFETLEWLYSEHPNHLS